MQIKTIEKNIKSKLNKWLETITDKALRERVKENLLVTGGSIPSMFLNEPVNDYDVYLMDMDVCKEVAVYYAKDIREILVLDGREKDRLVSDYNRQYDGVNHLDGDKLAIDQNNSYAISLRNLHPDQIKLYFGGKAGLKVNDGIDPDKLNYTPLYFSANAISLSDNVQVVLRFWGTPDVIHKTFDYIHATNYFTFKEGLVTNIAALESILTKQLKYQGSLYSVTSIIRAKKFIKRGWNINAGELLKIMFQISQIDLNDPDVLEEQLVGVDVAYFDALITALRNKMDSDKDFKLSNQFFNDLVDKIFNESEDEGAV